MAGALEPDNAASEWIVYSLETGSEGFCRIITGLARRVWPERLQDEREPTRKSSSILVTLTLLEQGGLGEQQSMAAN